MNLGRRWLVVLFLITFFAPFARAQPHAVDPRYRSPRATVRTFLVAMNQSEDDPRKIEEAVACLDPAGLAPDRRNGGRLAFELEYVLRSTNIPTGVISDVADEKECEIGEGKDIRLRLHRVPDGRWLFDPKTLQNLVKMRLLLWEKAVAAGQAKDAVDVPAGFRSPYAMVRTYFDAMKKGNLDAAAECIDLADLPAPSRAMLGRQLAFKLKEVLDRNIFVIFQDIPDTSAGLPLEAVVQKEGRITVERQFSGKRKGQWLFNRATVQTLDEIYAESEARPLVPELVAQGRSASVPQFGQMPNIWLRQCVPAWLKSRIAATGSWSLAPYQILGMVLLVGMIVPVYRAVTGPARRILRFLLERRSAAVDERDLRSWVRPIGWLAVVWMLMKGVTLLDFRVELAAQLLAVLVPAYTLTIAIVLYQLIDPILKLVAGPILGRAGATTFAAMGYPVLALVLKIAVVGCGIASLLDLFEFDVATVVAGLGIGGLAFALAAQDTLKNFFGSLMLIADRTFRVGDLVQIGENRGVVESVGLRTTRIRGLDDSLLTIPNADLTTAHVTNFGARRSRRFQTHITVPYVTSPDVLGEFRDGILTQIRGNSSVRQEDVQVALNDLGNEGVQILVQVFFATTDAQAELSARDALILEILRLADRLGIALDTTDHSISK